MNIRAIKVLKYLSLILCLTAGAAEPSDSELAGIGVELGMEGQNIVVKRIFPDTPAAAQKSLHVGDRITAVAQDKEPAVQVQKLRQAQTLIRGPKGTPVCLTIIPAEEDDSHARVVSFVSGEIKELVRWGDGVLLTNGTKAPSIEMVAVASKTPERLSDYAGKVIVLEFWATWCGPCQPGVSPRTLTGANRRWRGQFRCAVHITSRRWLSSWSFKASASRILVGFPFERVL